MQEEEGHRVKASLHVCLWDVLCRWERQFEEWRGMEATLRVQLNNPAFLQYLNEAAAQSTLSPRGALSALVSSCAMRDDMAEKSGIAVLTL